MAERADNKLPDQTLPEQFSITLYPNSAFFMPLSTNRFYTHETRPSMLDANMLPTRLGYVVRCSSTEAVYKDGQTWLKTDDEPVPLEASSPEGVTELRRLYAEENKTDAFIDYDGKFLFSMNQGDYSEPIYHPENGYRAEDEFRTYLNLIPSDSFKGDLFEELAESARFEQLGKGRRGTVLVHPEDGRGTPIVRTTSRYQSPAQCFRSIHVDLARQIREKASLPFAFNNALFETYTNAYAKMGFHSDQALDLADGSHIALFSCYQDPDSKAPLRRLVVQSKDPDGTTFEIPLEHNSVVIFSLETNRRFKHKIVLDTSRNPPENPWIGLTLRTSKTFVQTGNGEARFEDGTAVALATEEQQKEFFSLRGRENRETDFLYPHLTFTLSESDRLPPESAS